MPRISDQQKLAVDALDALLQITIRTFHGTPPETLAFLRELSDAVGQEVAYLECAEERLLLTHYSVCLFQVNMMASKYDGSPDCLNRADIQGSQFNDKDAGFNSVRDAVNNHSNVFLAASSLRLLELAMERFGVDIPMAQRISEMLFANFESRMANLSVNDVLDLPIRVAIFSSPFILLDSTSFLSRCRFIECKQVTDNNEEASHLGLLTLAIYREFNDIVRYSLSQLYASIILNKRNVRFSMDGRLYEFNAEELKFTLSSMKLGPYREVVREFVENGECKPIYRLCPVREDGMSSDYLLSLIRYGTALMSYKLFNRNGKRLRLDKSISMIGGAYMFLREKHLASDKNNPKEEDDSRLRLFDADIESDSLANRVSSWLRQFGIRVGPKSIYKEFIYGKLEVYTPVSEKWQALYDLRLELDPFGVYLAQWVSGTFEYMETNPKNNSGVSGVQTAQAGE